MWEELFGWIAFVKLLKEPEEQITTVLALQVMADLATGELLLWTQGSLFLKKGEEAVSVQKRRMAWADIS